MAWSPSAARSVRPMPRSLRFEPGVMQLAFFIDQSRCSGCFTCVVACRQWHSSEGEVTAWRRVETMEEGTFPHVRVTFLSLSCLHCRKPLCLSACPVEAIFKRHRDGLVLVDPARCMGGKECGLCRKACPFHLPQFNPHQEFRMEKCDFCAKRLDEGKRPLCVEACPMEALDWGPFDLLLEKHGQRKGIKGNLLLKESEPSVLIKGKG